MGLISRVSSRTYRRDHLTSINLIKSQKMFARKALRYSIRGANQARALSNNTTETLFEPWQVEKYQRAMANEPDIDSQVPAPKANVSLSSTETNRYSSDTELKKKSLSLPTATCPNFETLKPTKNDIELTQNGF